MDAKLISVVIPVYNGEKYLAAALDSVYAQDYRPLEVVMVDDGSTDGSADVAKSYPEVCYVYHHNQGHSVAKNTGLANCTGELISFIDADDLWAPGKLRAQYDYLESHPEIGCVISKMRNFLDGLETPPGWVVPAMLTEDWTAYSLGTLLSHRWVFDQIGHFNEAYYHGNDLDWFIRLAESKIPMAIMPEMFLLRRVHASNLSRDQGRLARERIRILKAAIDRKRQNSAQAQAASQS